MMARADPLPAPRAELLERLSPSRAFDLAVIGGGATGLSIALDAAVRGLRVVLVEANDFAAGTSSRSTKLVHGGVRYLAHGELGLVREALEERALLLRNAAHLARPLPFIVPAASRSAQLWYGCGLKLYEWLAGDASLGPTALLDAVQTARRLGAAGTLACKGSVVYHDGQFDDARLALALARTAAAHGALLVNHCAATSLAHNNGRVAGLTCRDTETGRTWTVKAGCVINATGVWVDRVRQQDASATARTVASAVTPSQGVHLVVDGRFCPRDHAILVPKTADGRVFFAVPWLGKTILGTTDTACREAAEEPRPQRDEVAFLLREAARCLPDAPGPADVRSLWAGLRPLVSQPGRGPDTGALSRRHAVLVSDSALVSVTGGKWTTSRSIAQDVLDRCTSQGLLPRGAGCRTRELRLVGAVPPGTPAPPLGAAPGLHLYGSERPWVERLPGAGHLVCEHLDEAMIRFAARYEYARTVEDVLARRARVLFLDARAAAAAAPRVAAILAAETGADPRLPAFERLARLYSTLPGEPVPDGLPAAEVRAA